MLSMVRNAGVRPLHLVCKIADTCGMSAFITVSDAAGHVLFRRPATDAEIVNAMHAVELAEREGRAAMIRVADERVEAGAAENIA